MKYTISLNKNTLPLNQIYYLASPYSSGIDLNATSEQKEKLRNLRHKQIQKIATELILQGYTLIEPIATSHYKDVHFGLPQDYEFWKDRDRTFIRLSDGVIVAKLPGWNLSRGVKDEIKYAKAIGLPVFYIEPQNILDFLNANKNTRPVHIGD